ncbi:MAG: SIR2 family protein [Gammaproteobacteria bacterium]|nr:SIR2 family protein [Gammaproteobacteria bacterium]
MSSSKTVSFLFGSGLSVPAGFPRMTEITSQIMSGENCFRHTDGVYYLNEQKTNQPFYPHAIPAITEFLKEISALGGEFDDQNSSQQANYEEIYYWVAQICDNDIGEYENPIVQVYVNQIKNKIDDMLRSLFKGEVEKWSFSKLVEETANYILDTVWWKLEMKPGCLNYLDFLDQAIQRNARVNIFTLNHDKLLEEYFSSKGIDYIDGFGDKENEIRYLDLALFDSNSEGIFLHKLHGSIGWFRFNESSGFFQDRHIGIPIINDHWHARNSTGTMQTPSEGRPILLAGTFNKILQYTNEIFFDLHYQFFRNLRQSSKLVVIGYGFGDKAINYQIVRWMFEKNDNRLLVIHQNPVRLVDYARKAISRHWDSWIDSGKVQLIEKNIEDVESSDWAGLF